MQLDLQARAALEAETALGLPPPWSVSPAQARENYRRLRGLFRGQPAPVASAEDLLIDLPGRVLRLRHYRPAGSRPGEPLPALVFYHGGGFALGDLDTHDLVCRDLANACEAAVLSVAYRLAPEHPFPAPVEDAVDALRWVRDAAGRLSIDPARIAVAGDSAGGNLAAVAALAVRGEAPALSMQVLVYPVLDHARDSPSRRALASGYGLGREALEWFRSIYLRSPAEFSDWRASPLLAGSLAGLPPAYVIIAGFDPLRDDGERYAERLDREGVAASCECFEGMIHGFLLMGGKVAAAHHAVSRIAQQLRPVWKGGSSGRAGMARSTRQGEGGDGR